MRNDALPRGYAEVLYAAALFSFTLLFFAPMVILYLNPEEFPFTAPGIVPYLIALSLACTCVLSLYPLVLPAAFRRRAVSLLIAFSFLLWLQGNIFAWRFGPLDGTVIRWETLNGLAVRDGVIWGAVCAAALLGYRFVFRFARRMIAAILAVQVMGLMYLILQAPEEANFKRYFADEKQFMNFSPDGNVVMVLLDSFQSNVFQRVLEEDRSIGSTFDGFTYFQNTVGGYPETRWAVPLIMTGRYLDNAIPYRKFMREAYSRSLPGVLKRSGYQFHIQGTWEYGLDVTLASNVTPRPRAAPVDVPTLARLYDTALLRYLPFFAKKYVWCDLMGILERRAVAYARAPADSGKEDTGGRKEERNMELLKYLISGMDTRCSSRTFKYIHFFGVHPPLLLNEKCEYEPMPATAESYERQAKGLLRIVGKYLDLLKKHDVYDKSLIIILGDHGFGFSYPLSPEMRERCARPEGAEALPHHAPGVFPKDVMARGSPLLLIKPSRSAGMMRISDAPVCLGDIPATIVSELGLTAEFPGRSVFAVAESETRVRNYYHYETGIRLKEGFAPILREYAVKGFAWCPDAWSATGYLLSPGKGRIADQVVGPVTAP
jgi:hypothetical protein